MLITIFFLRVGHLSNLFHFNFDIWLNMNRTILLKSMLLLENFFTHRSFLAFCKMSFVDMQQIIAPKAQKNNGGTRMARYRDKIGDLKLLGFPFKEA